MEEGEINDSEDDVEEIVQINHSQVLAFARPVFGGSTEYFQQYLEYGVNTWGSNCKIKILIFLKIRFS